MSVWVIHQSLSPSDEEKIHQRAGVFLPFENIPDLSLVRSQGNFRELLTKLYPELPPESIMLTLDRMWAQFSGVQMDDIVVVPLPAKKSVAIGRVNGPYRYATEDGRDLHMFPVEWYPVLPTVASFGKFKTIFENPQRMFEVTDKEARIKIHDKLPHRFNRFAKWKWLLIIFFLMQAVAFISGMFHQ